MGEWGQKAKDRCRAIREYKIDEAAEATIEILNQLFLKSPTRTILKRSLLPRIAKQINRNRRADGALFLPNIEGREVKRPNLKFIENHWSEIREQCANAYKKYIVWEAGKPGGFRLGKLKEYAKQQSSFVGIADGVTETHNDRAAVINRDGGDSIYIGVTSLPELEKPDAI